MNEEIAKIRRERWLQTQRKSATSPSTSQDVTQEEKLDRKNGLNEEGKAASHGSLTSDKNAMTSKTSCDYIDLTLSDSDDDDSEKSTSTSINIPVSRKRKETLSKYKKSQTSSSSTSTSSSSASIRSSEKMKAFSICSYNIWFGEPHPSQRMSKISEIISELSPRPTFLGLQEVTPALLRDLSPLLQSMGYRIICQEGVAYGCALGILTGATVGSKDNDSSPSARVISSGFQRYAMTQMERGLLWVIANVESVGEVLFSTTHLESYIRENDGSREREMQIEEAGRFCLEKVSEKASLKCCMITGDLNWDDERKRSTGTDKNLLSVMNDASRTCSSRDGSQWSDAWSETQPGKEGYTYDSKTNPMLKGNLRRRFDRCLVLSPSNSIAIRSTDLIGKEEIVGLKWKKESQKWSYGKPVGVYYDERPLAPSDHFGLVASFGEAKATESPSAQSGPVKKRRRE